MAFDHIKTCVTCAHFAVIPRATVGRSDAKCSVSALEDKNAYEERRTGDCGPDGVKWEKNDVAG